MRGAKDIDAFFKEDSKIKELIYTVGEKFGVNEPEELWLNNSVPNLNDLPNPPAMLGRIE